MKSAEFLFKAAGRNPQDDQPSGRQKYSWRDRKALAESVLRLYVAAKLRAGNPPQEEYVWLDEFCLSADSLTDKFNKEETKGVKENIKREIKANRDYELGKIADIFRGATTVCVFCHVLDCDHANPTCPWGLRLFTIPEILHAAHVTVITLQTKESGKPHMYSLPAYQFRGKMQAEASKEELWHLHAILQHAANSGAVSWQTAIHSLVVEAIRRNEAENYSNRLLGKALNCLLPRRARLEDLKGENGWEDLAWLLELNQGFFNAASLAAVCSVAAEDVPSYRWWGRPLTPEEGKERLEPLVTAFPARIIQNGTSQPSLCIVGPQTIPLEHMLRRDSTALRTHEDMRGLKYLAFILFAILAIISLAIMTSRSIPGGLALLIGSSILFVILELLVGTIYVVKEEGCWVYLDDTECGPNTRGWLVERDCDFRKESFTWGDRQLTPQWEVPQLRDRKPWGSTGTLVDLKHRVFVRTAVIGRPDQLVVLAVHGIGITCMLLHRPKDTPLVASKVAMANMPPYMLRQATKSGTVYVGDTRELLETVDERPDTPNSMSQTDLEKGLLDVYHVEEWNPDSTHDGP